MKVGNQNRSDREAALCKTSLARVLLLPGIPTFMYSALSVELVFCARPVENGSRFARAVAIRADPDLPVLRFSLDDGVIEFASFVGVDLHLIESRPSIPGMSGIAVDV